MRPKSLLLLALALGCGLVASIGISQVMDQNARGQGPTMETSPIYVALHNINLGDPIDATMVSLQEWPKDRIPVGAITELEVLEGRRPRTNIIQGEPILDAKLLAQGEYADPIAQIPSGFRLSTIPVDAEKSAAGLLSPGDRVDIQLFVNRNERAGFDKPMTKVILQNIRVYAVEQAVQRSADGAEARTIPKTVSLVVTPDQASRIDLAQNLGELSLIPRNPNDDEATAGIEVTAEDLFASAGERNTREKEQIREEEGEEPSQEGGFFSGLMSMMSQAAKEQPPFRMEIIRADEVSEVMFDAATGRPIRESVDNNQEPSQQSLTAPLTQPTGDPGGTASKPNGPEVDFPIDFLDD